MTPEQRLEKYASVISSDRNIAAIYLERLFTYLSDHPDPNERALGQMLRNGVVVSGTQHGSFCAMWTEEGPAPDCDCNPRLDYQIAASPTEEEK